MIVVCWKFGSPTSSAPSVVHFPCGTAICGTYRWAHSSCRGYSSLVCAYGDTEPQVEYAIQHGSPKPYITSCISNPLILSHLRAESIHETAFKRTSTILFFYILPRIFQSRSFPYQHWSYAQSSEQTMNMEKQSQVIRFAFYKRYLQQVIYFYEAYKLLDNCGAGAKPGDRAMVLLMGKIITENHSLKLQSFFWGFLSWTRCTGDAVLPLLWKTYSNNKVQASNNIFDR